MPSCVCCAHTQALVHKRQAEYQVQLQKHAKLQRQHEEQQEQLVSGNMSCAAVTCEVAAAAMDHLQHQQATSTLQEQGLATALMSQMTPYYQGPGWLPSSVIS